MNSTLPNSLTALTQAPRKAGGNAAFAPGAELTSAASTSADSFRNTLDKLRAERAAPAGQTPPSRSLPVSPASGSPSAMPTPTPPGTALPATPQSAAAAKPDVHVTALRTARNAAPGSAAGSTPESKPESTAGAVTRDTSEPQVATAATPVSAPARPAMATSPAPQPQAWMTAPPAPGTGAQNPQVPSASPGKSALASRPERTSQPSTSHTKPAQKEPAKNQAGITAPLVQAPPSMAAPLAVGSPSGPPAANPAAAAGSSLPPAPTAVLAAGSAAAPPVAVAASKATQAGAAVRPAVHGSRQAAGKETGTAGNTEPTPEQLALAAAGLPSLVLPAAQLSGSPAPAAVSPTSRTPSAKQDAGAATQGPTPQPLPAAHPTPQAAGTVPPPTGGIETGGMQTGGNPVTAAPADASAFVSAMAAPTARGADLSAAAQVAAPRPSASYPDFGSPTMQVTPAVILLAKQADGSSQMTVSLHPKDLGEVSVSVVRQNDGSTSITVAASNPQTLHELTQNAHHLHAALDAANLPTDNRNLSFVTPAELSSSDRQPSSSPERQSTSSQGGSDPNAQRQPSQGQAYPQANAGSTAEPAYRAASTAASLQAGRQTWRFSGLNITA